MIRIVENRVRTVLIEIYKGSKSNIAIKSTSSGARLGLHASSILFTSCVALG